MKRTEPTAFLAGSKGQPKLDYMPAAATDITARFKRMRDQKLAQEPGIVQLKQKVKR
jgi:hypothetical protein